MKYKEQIRIGNIHVLLVKCVHLWVNQIDVFFDCRVHANCRDDLKAFMTQIGTPPTVLNSLTLELEIWPARGRFSFTEGHCV